MNPLQARIFLRTLYRRRAYTLINIIGLSTGLASFLVLILYVQNEMGYDRHLPDADRIFRVVEIQQAPGLGEQHVAITMGPLGPMLTKDLSQVESSLRIMPAWNYRVVRAGEKVFRENYQYYADSSIFSFFGLRLIEGSSQGLLTGLREVAISEDLAIKYFGSTKNSIGQSLSFHEDVYQVKAVFINPPGRSHLTFKILLPMEAALAHPDFQWLKGWGTNSLITFVKLFDQNQRAETESLLNTYIENNMPRTRHDDPNMAMYLQPLGDVYLHSGHIKFQMYDKTGNLTQVRLFGMLSVLILAIACINFVNLALAGSMKRAREVGIKKVLGACRFTLIRQFLSEAALMTILSTIIALVIAELVLPLINPILFTELRLEFFGNFLINPGLIILTVLVILATGAYPAWYLSRFQPVIVLKGSTSAKGKSGWLNKSLIIFQFAISIGMIFGVIVINRQYRYILGKELGISYKDRIYAGFTEPDGYKKIQIIRSQLLQNPMISDVAAASDANGVSGSQGPVTTDDSLQVRVAVRFGFVDPNFFPAMEIPLIRGRNFSSSSPSDSGCIILNEAAAIAFGWSDPVGKKLSITAAAGSDSARPPVLSVIGVIADYHYYSLRTRIEPAVFLMEPERYSGMVIRLSQGLEKNQRDSVMKYVEHTWNEFFPQNPFSGGFVEDRMQLTYASDKNLVRMFFWFTILSIIISCMGLLGISALEAEKRTREIGIRKAIGGSSNQIGFLLMKQFLVLVIAGGILIMPFAWILINKVLSGFAYRVQVTITDVLVALLAGLVIAALSILTRVIKASMANPVEAIKYE